MLTGYLYINFYNNTYTTAVCEVCACVGLVAVYAVSAISVGPSARGRQLRQRADNSVKLRPGGPTPRGDWNFIKILNKSELKSIYYLNEHVLYIFCNIWAKFEEDSKLGK